VNGVTIDDVTDISSVLKAYDQIPGQRLARVVCDAGLEPSYYYYAFGQLRRPAFSSQLICLPVDSSDTDKYRMAGYSDRYWSFAKALHPGDWLEVNEVNGSWCGPDSLAKASRGIGIANGLGLISLCTLYGEADSSGDLTDLWYWLDRNAGLLSGPSVVGISFYPRQSPYLVKDWDAVFAKLGDYFPSSRLIFSELGDDGDTEASAEVTREVISQFVGKKVSHPRFVGGYLYWDFVEQMAKGPFLPDLLKAYGSAS
jgi:hypothetical protein